MNESYKDKGGGIFVFIMLLPFILLFMIIFGLGILFMKPAYKRRCFICDKKGNLRSSKDIAIPNYKDFEFAYMDFLYHDSCMKGLENNSSFYNDGIVRILQIIKTGKMSAGEDENGYLPIELERGLKPYQKDKYAYRIRCSYCWRIVKIGTTYWKVYEDCGSVNSNIKRSEKIIIDSYPYKMLRGNISLQCEKCYYEEEVENLKIQIGKLKKRK